MRYENVEPVVPAPPCARMTAENEGVDNAYADNYNPTE